MHWRYTKLLLLVTLLFSLLPSYAQQAPEVKTTVKLIPKIRPLDANQTVGSTESAADSLALVLSSQQLRDAARVIGLNHGKHYITDQDRLFITGAQSQTRWGIYHPTQSYSQDESEFVQLKVVAWAELQESGEKMSRLQITRLLQEVRADDIALPIEWSERRD